ncbi:MAG: 4a-hydroxytetrahydrobiopterin dehydratase [Dehalococcoidia bacterium]
MSALVERRCVACRPGSPTITPSQIVEFHPQIPDWTIVEVGGVLRLERQFHIRRWADALVLVAKVGALAEEEDHHPAILLEWGKVTVWWWTQAIGGLHVNDFVAAAKTDQRARALTGA